MPSTSPQDLTFLQVIENCDNAHLYQPSFDSLKLSDAERSIPLYLSQSPSSLAISLLHPQLIKQLKVENQRSRELNQPELWVLQLDEGSWVKRDRRPLGPSVSLADWSDSHEKRSTALRELCERWRDEGTFTEKIGPKKWRNEMFPVYADYEGVHDHPSRGEVTNYVFELERSACLLFGFVTYGVHMNVYQEVTGDDGTRRLNIWIPTRSKTKSSFPGMLDNTVAGGLPSGISTFECIAKECEEEASYSPDLVKKYIRAAGSVSCFSRTRTGWLEPQVEYTYDMAIPEGVDPNIFAPKPSDGEVEYFELLDQEEVIKRMRQGLFKPNCALVILDLLMRLGYITPDNEPDYQKIITRLHGTFDFDRW